MGGIFLAGRSGVFDNSGNKDTDSISGLDEKFSNSRSFDFKDDLPCHFEVFYTDEADEPVHVPLGIALGVADDYRTSGQEPQVLVSCASVEVVAEDLEDSLEKASVEELEILLSDQSLEGVQEVYIAPNNELSSGKAYIAKFGIDEGSYYGFSLSAEQIYEGYKILIKKPQADTGERNDILPIVSGVSTTIGGDKYGCNLSVGISNNIKGIQNENDKLYLNVEEGTDLNVESLDNYSLITCEQGLETSSYEEVSLITSGFEKIIQPGLVNLIEVIYQKESDFIINLKDFDVQLSIDNFNFEYDENVTLDFKDVLVGSDRSGLVYELTTDENGNEIRKFADEGGKINSEILKTAPAKVEPPQDQPDVEEEPQITEQVYTNPFFNNLKLVYPSDWSFNSFTEPEFYDNLLTRYIELKKNNSTLTLKIQPKIIAGCGPFFEETPMHYNIPGSYNEYYSSADNNHYYGVQGDCTTFANILTSNIDVDFNDKYAQFAGQGDQYVIYQLTIQTNGNINNFPEAERNEIRKIIENSTFR